ncbi:MAG: hypothetical protein MK165_00885 [Pirellulaceae bacterium]|nr:hypothetical protein [Pirellulaceae bacterium]
MDQQAVEIIFDCLPLRSVGRLDVPMDASPKFRQRCERIKGAIQKHGSHNSYFLHDAKCTFRLTNDDAVGILQFSFEGTVLTDIDDSQTESCDLRIELVRETCDWLTEPVVEWFESTVCQAVRIEFNRYIDAGDLEQAKKRVEEIQATSDNAGGYVGMYL